MAMTNPGDIIGSMLSGFATGDPNSFMKQQQLQNNFLLQLQKMKMEEEELGLRKNEITTRNKLFEMQMRKTMQEEEWNNTPMGDLFTQEKKPVSNIPNVESGEEEGAYTTKDVPTGNYNVNMEAVNKLPFGKFKQVSEGMKNFKDIISPKKEKLATARPGDVIYGEESGTPRFSVPDKQTSSQSDIGKFASDIGIDLKSLNEDGVNRVGQIWQKVHGKDKDKLHTTVSYDEKGNGFAHIINLDTKKAETVPLGPVGKPGKSGSEVNVNVGEKGMEQLSKTMGEEIAKQQKDVEGAYQSLQGLQDAKSLMKSGIVTGFGAEFLVGLGKALQQVGFNVGKDEISNTEAFAATMGNQVGKIIKQFGSGTGLSDADRLYAEKIAGGKITLNRESIEKIIRMNEKGLRNSIKNYNLKAEEVMGKSGASSLPYDLRIKVDPGLMKDELQLMRYKDIGTKKTYDIPVDELEDFKKAFPNAERVF